MLIADIHICARCWFIQASCHGRRTMRSRFEQFGQQLIRAALEGRGRVELDVEYPAFGSERAPLRLGPD